ncbi:MAG: GH92 family glycosyl hydrolase [Chitinophagaceae bacterium]|nr:GH92 family glycosyl hydrolase [Chitinophagaceae bacterium]
MAQSVTSKMEAEPVSFVNPFIGTSKKSNGNTFPGATSPFGMVQLTPATCLFGKNKNTYVYDTLKVTGFVSTILSGTGGSCFGDGLFMPWCGSLKQSPGDNWYAYQSNLDHNKEEASPGYYSNLLHHDSLRIELTATKRVGMVKFSRFKDDLNVFINPSLNQNVVVLESSVRIDGNNRVVGNTKSGRFWNDKSEYTVYFVMEFSRPFSSMGAWKGADMQKGRSVADGKDAGAFVTFKKNDPSPVLMKIGISYVSEQNAILNMQLENPGWDFEAIRLNARKEWNDLLGRVQVQGGDINKKTVFYTAMYHAFLHPNTFSDVNGDYIGFDSKIHNTGGKYVHYTNFSGWDVYRNQIPLMGMLVPDVANDFAVSMTNNALQAGAMPKWSVANDETGVMIGDPATASMASLFSFGIRDFDYRKTYELMLKAATQPGIYCRNFEVRPNLEQYLKNGFIADDNHTDRSSVSMSQEYNIADFALAQMALQLGDSMNGMKLRKQALTWRNYFNKEKGFLWPIMSDGSFRKDFDPFMKPYTMPEIGFCEANANTYLWMIPHDVKALVEMLGGKDMVVSRLDVHDYIDLRNEPAYITAWLYNYLGEPQKTQKVVRQALQRFYLPGPDGIPGNDDLGQMSSWCVGAYMGLFPAIPGTDLLLLSTPMFPKIVIDNKRDKKIEIVTENLSDSNYTIQHYRVNGKAQPRPWLNWGSLGKGSKLKLKVGEQDEGWWKAQDHYPGYFMLNE